MIFLLYSLSGRLTFAHFVADWQKWIEQDKEGKAWKKGKHPLASDTEIYQVLWLTTWMIKRTTIIMGLDCVFIYGNKRRAVKVIIRSRERKRKRGKKWSCFKNRGKIRGKEVRDLQRKRKREDFKRTKDKEEGRKNMRLICVFIQIFPFSSSCFSSISSYPSHSSSPPRLSLASASYLCCVLNLNGN